MSSLKLSLYRKEAELLKKVGKVNVPCKVSNAAPGDYIAFRVLSGLGNIAERDSCFQRAVQDDSSVTVDPSFTVVRGGKEQIRILYTMGNRSLSVNEDFFNQRFCEYLEFSVSYLVPPEKKTSSPSMSLLIPEKPRYKDLLKIFGEMLDKGDPLPADWRETLVAAATRESIDKAFKDIDNMMTGVAKKERSKKESKENTENPPTPGNSPE